MVNPCVHGVFEPRKHLYSAQDMYSFHGATLTRTRARTHAHTLFMTMHLQVWGVQRASQACIRQRRRPLGLPWGRPSRCWRRIGPSWKDTCAPEMLPAWTELWGRRNVSHSSLCAINSWHDVGAYADLSRRLIIHGKPCSSASLVTCSNLFDAQCSGTP